MSSITAAHWHLLFNHLPVVGDLFTVILLIYALIRNNAELKRAALIACIIVGITGFMADTTGGPAAQATRNLPGINRDDVRAHAQSADSALIAAEVLGALGIVGLVLALRKKEVAEITTNPRVWAKTYKVPPSWVMILCLLLSLADAYLMLRAANLGGAIRHPEIRDVPASVPATT